MMYDKHIFICMHQRAERSQRKSCGEAQGLELTSSFKERLKELDLVIEVRAQKAGCLGICDFGPTVAVYPEGVFYVGVKLSDIEEIIQSHIINNSPVERLLLKKESLAKL